jgi:hypothetical protein
MKDNTTSQRHQNNNLKAIITFTEFLGSDKTFYQVRSKDQITCFLDTKMKTDPLDPEKRWNTTWNDYLVRIKHFFRWLHNTKIKSAKGLKTQSIFSLNAEWETSHSVHIDKTNKATKPLSRLEPDLNFLVHFFNF